jgi:hypothetical protein
MEPQMKISLNGKEYTLAKEMDGTPVVLVRVNRRLSRVASERDSLLVLAGLNVCPLRLVA